MAFVLEDSYNINDNGGVTNDNSNWYGQTFTASSAYTATRIKLKVYTNTAGTININLYATAAGKPDGGSIATASANSSSFDATPGSFFAFDLDSSVALSNGFQYAIVVEPVAAGGAACGFRRNTAGAYGGGTGLFSGNQGSSWSTLATQDFMFEVYSGSGAIEEGTKTITAAAVVSLATDLTVLGEGIKTVTVVATVSLATQTYVSQKGFPTPRPGDYDGDDYWDETNGVWGSTRTTHPGNWVQNVLAISEEGEIYFRVV